jgi:hypothetical protein
MELMAHITTIGMQWKIGALGSFQRVSFGRIARFFDADA